MDWSLVYNKSERFVEKAIGKEKVLVPLTDNVADMNKVFNLNEVAAFIYDTIDGEKSIDEVRATVMNSYEVPEEDALNDINSFITEMVNNGVLFLNQ